MSYVQGFVTPVPTAGRQAYLDAAAKMAPILAEYGAERIVECWGEDVPEGKVTDFRKAVQAKADETVVFSWIVYPDRATCDAAAEKMRSDPRMQPDGSAMPFDAGRMIYGGFAPIFDSGASQDGIPE